MDEDEVAFPGQRQRTIEGAVVVVPVKHDFRTQVHHGLHLDVGRSLRHHHRRRDSAAAGRERDALGMVSGGRADDAALGDRVGEMRDPVIGAAQLE